MKISILTDMNYAAFKNSKKNNANMKTNKFLAFFTIIAMGFAVTSCVQDDDFTVPESLGTEENRGLEILLAEINADEVTLMDIVDVKDLYTTAGDTPIFVENGLAFKGYVSSSDQTGNFFKEVFLQDSPDNPTTGIKLIINQVDSYNQYNVGREVYVRLTGLYIGEERVGSDVITIGGTTETDQFGTTVARLTENQRATKIFRSETTAEIVPKVQSFSQISSEDIGVFVKFENVQFADNLNGARYFDPSQDFDTQRTLQACDGFGYSNFKLETSSFASFKEALLPTGNGSIAGVIAKTFDASAFILALNNLDDVNMEGSRCAPLSIDDFTVVYEEDFESAVNNTNLDFTGWTNFAEAGTFKWREKTFSGNGYAEFSTFNSGSPSNIAWLITPSFDMDAQENEFLNFKAAQHHLDSPNNTLEIFVSSDYDGTNVLATTWIQIDAAIPTQSNDWYEFVDSGLIDLSSYTGNLYVAFKVVGSGTDTTLDGAYQIDDVVLLATE